MSFVKIKKIPHHFLTFHEKIVNDGQLVLRISTSNNTITNQKDSNNGTLNLDAVEVETMLKYELGKSIGAVM